MVGCLVGHKVGQLQVCMSDDNIAKSEQPKKPITKPQLRSVLGLANYYRNHIPHILHLAAPLTALTNKCTPKATMFFSSVFLACFFRRSH